MSVRISRQHWDGLLGELDQARRQRHLLTYRALLERLQLPTPAMQTLTAALEHLAAVTSLAPTIVSFIMPASLPIIPVILASAWTDAPLELGVDPPYLRTQRLRI